MFCIINKALQLIIQIKTAVCKYLKPFGIYPPVQRAEESFLAGRLLVNTVRYITQPPGGIGSYVWSAVSAEATKTAALISP